MIYRRYLLLGCPMESIDLSPGTVLAIYEDLAVAVADLQKTRGQDPPRSIIYWIREVWTGDPRTFPLPPFGSTHPGPATGLQIVRREAGQLSTVILTKAQQDAVDVVRAALIEIYTSDSDILGTGAQMMLAALDNFASSCIEPRPR